MPVHRILVATDLSQASPSVLKTGLDVARQFEAETTVFHVFSDAEYEDQRRAVPTALDAYADHLAMQIKHQMAELSTHGHAHVEVVPGDGVADQIIAAARRARADLIILGTHGRTGLRRVLMGSVAEAVLRHTDIPVLIVPTLATASHEA